MRNSLRRNWGKQDWAEWVDLETLEQDGPSQRSWTEARSWAFVSLHPLVTGYRPPQGGEVTFGEGQIPLAERLSKETLSKEKFSCEPAICSLHSWQLGEWGRSWVGQQHPLHLLWRSSELIKVSWFRILTMESESPEFGPLSTTYPAG